MLDSSLFEICKFRDKTYTSHGEFFQHNYFVFINGKVKIIFFLHNY